MKIINFILVLILFSLPSYGKTNVSGNITTNTKWTLISSPYNLTSNLTINPGVALEVEPGVFINGNNFKIETYGILKFLGNLQNNINIYDLLLDIKPYTADTTLLYYLNMNNVAISHYRAGRLELINSKVYNCNEFFISDNSDSCLIKYNIFNYSSGILTHSYCNKVLVENNIFLNPIQDKWESASNTDVYYSVSNNYSIDLNSSPIVQYNSFIDTSKIALRLIRDNSFLNAKNNYFHTINKKTIDNMIYDKKDNFLLLDTIAYHPYLLNNHPNTPVVALFSCDTLFGLEKEDTIKFYNFSIGYNIDQYFWDFGDGDTSVEVNPIHVYKKPGKYTVRLRIKNYKYSDIEVKTNYITIIPFTVNSGIDKSIICGGKVQFDNPVTNYTGSGTLAYSWLPKAGLDSAQLAQPTAEVTANTSYVLEVTTPNGCKAKDTVKVTVDALTVNSGIDKSIICGGKVQFDNPVTNYTGSGTLAYSWLPKAGLDSAQLAQPTAEVTANTSYVLEVTTPNGCIAKDTIKVTVNPLSVTINDIAGSCGNATSLFASTNYTGLGNLTYNWSPSEGLSSTNTAETFASIVTGTEYFVEVKTPNGCVANDKVSLSTSVISFIPTICVVSVNENDDNVIVWQRNTNNAIDSFFIYRESSTQTDQYELIGKLPHSSLGVFVDSASNARVQSNKYKISIKDVCGFETEKSPEHKTMHLTINKGIGNSWNLIWEQYVGISVSSYKIYRGTSKNDLVQIGTSSGSNTSYTDVTAPVGDVYYQIEVVLPNACSNLKSTSYGSSRSNIISNADIAIGISSKVLFEPFIYPNPANDVLNLKKTDLNKTTVMIFDMHWFSPL